MKFTIIYLISFVLSSIFTILGAMFKILHLPFGTELLGTGYLFSLAYIILGLIDVWKRPLDTVVKLMWLVGFIFISWITGLVSIFVYPKRYSTDPKL